MSATHVASVLGQRIMEVIVVDDGSTDATPGVLLDLAGADPRVRIITTPPLGRGAALRSAVRAARGDFILNIDADDVIHPEWIHLGPSLLAGNPAMAVVAAHPHYIAGGETVQWLRMESAPAIQDVTTHLAFYNPIIHSSAVMRRTAIESVGGYEVARRFHFDYDLWVRLARAGWRLWCRRLAAHRQTPSRRTEVRASSSMGLPPEQRVHPGAGDSDGGRWRVRGWASLVGRLGWGLLPHPVRMMVRRRLVR